MKKPDPCAVVIFGATGDLTSRKLMPSLQRLFESDALPDDLRIVAAGRKPADDYAASLKLDPAFASHVEYVVAGPGADPGALREAIGSRARLFYLATPPSAYTSIVEWLGETGLADAGPAWSRIVVEKPFGRDAESADTLTASLHRVFSESQVFRIDHYLGKETVQNLFVFRFANGIFEPVWNRRYVDHVQITVAESLGVEQRGKYYEEAGALRDMVQNHLLQLVTLTAMEPPVEFSADAIRDEKVKVLHALEHSPASEVVRGQYSGYLAEKDVAAGSTTETHVALEVLIDNWRWAGVPWLLRTGKQMPKRVTEVAIHFKQAPFLPFDAEAVSGLQPNVLALRIQPNEGIQLVFGAKGPGDMTVRNVEMSFDYSDAFGSEPPEAYERLLLDAMLGDATLFTRADEVSRQWRFIDPLVAHASDVYEYTAGSWGPQEAATLIAPRKWRRL